MSEEEIDQDHEEWTARKAAIEQNLMKMFAVAPKDFIVGGKRYTVSMRSYEEGCRYDTDGVVGVVLVESDEEHFDFSLHLDGWGALRAMHPHEEEEGD